MDEVIGALVKRLQVMPASDLRSRAAILARVRGRRQSPWRAALAEAWQPSVPLLAAATIAVAALGIGYAWRVIVEPAPTVAAAPDGPTAGVTEQLVPVSNDGTVRLAQQFVLDAPAATRVLVVGDFNGWDRARAQRLERSEGGLWSATVLLRPGRYTYAYLVDDAPAVTLDPRATTARDEFGRSSSVILVTDK